MQKKEMDANLNFRDPFISLGPVLTLFSAKCLEYSQFLLHFMASTSCRCIKVEMAVVTQFGALYNARHIFQFNSTK